MSFVPCPAGSVLNKESFPFYRDVCPICNSSLIDFVEKDSQGHVSQRRLVRVCSRRPARKNILSSHQAKAHFFEITQEVLKLNVKVGISSVHNVSYRQEHHIKQEETHPSKYLLLVEYSTGRGKDLTEVTAKGNWRTLNIPGLWNPGKLTVDNYTEIYNKAKRLIHFT